MAGTRRCSPAPGEARKEATEEMRAGPRRCSPAPWEARTEVTETGGGRLQEAPAWAHATGGGGDLDASLTGGRAGRSPASTRRSGHRPFRTPGRPSQTTSAYSQREWERNLEDEEIFYFFIVLTGGSRSTSSYCAYFCQLSPDERVPLVRFGVNSLSIHF